MVFRNSDFVIDKFYYYNESNLPFIVRTGCFFYEKVGMWGRDYASR